MQKNKLPVRKIPDQENEKLKTGQKM